MISGIIIRFKTLWITRCVTQKVCMIWWTIEWITWGTCGFRQFLITRRGSTRVMAWGVTMWRTWVTSDVLSGVLPREILLPDGLSGGLSLDKPIGESDEPSGEQPNVLSLGLCDGEPHVVPLSELLGEADGEPLGLSDREPLDIPAVEYLGKADGDPLGESLGLSLSKPLGEWFDESDELSDGLSVDESLGESNRGLPGLLLGELLGNSLVGELDWSVGSSLGPGIWMSYGFKKDTPWSEGRGVPTTSLGSL